VAGSYSHIEVQFGFLNDRAFVLFSHTGLCFVVVSKLCDIKRFTRKKFYAYKHHITCASKPANRLKFVALCIHLNLHSCTSHLTSRTSIRSPISNLRHHISDRRFQNSYFWDLTSYISHPWSQISVLTLLGHLQRTDANALIIKSCVSDPDWWLA